MRARLLALGAFAVASVASVACSAILSLDPPEQEGGDGGVTLHDGSVTPGDSSATPETGTVLPEDSGPLTCAPLDLTVDAGDASITYLPFAQGPTTDGTPAWQFFDSANVTKTAKGPSFSGGAFDGRYLYFPTRNTDVFRYDTQNGLGFSAGWDFANTATLVPDAPDAGDAGEGGAPVDAGAAYAGGFGGAVFDGTFVYFIPEFATIAGVRTPERTVVRFDPRIAAAQSSFKTASAWSFFDVGTVDNAGPLNSGFLGATFDGRYLYLVPSNDGAPDGRVLRYDTKGVSATGPGADGGGAGFTEPSQWSAFDLTASFPGAGPGTVAGFAGAVFDGTSVYLVPSSNDAFDSGLHGGNSPYTARLNSVDASFTSAGSWTVFDLSRVSGSAVNFYGGAYDGQRYVYYAPRSGGVAVRFDTTMPSIGTAAAWSYYDVQRIVPYDGGPTVGYAGAAFDGRFVTFVPAGAQFGAALRYDTQSSFGADCAWSSIDLTTVDSGADAGNFTNASGAVFDGQYLYVVPTGSGVFARFLVRTSTGPLTLPPLPAFHGSFL